MPLPRSISDLQHCFLSKTDFITVTFYAACRLPVGGLLESLTGSEMPAMPGGQDAYFAKIAVKAPPVSFLARNLRCYSLGVLPCPQHGQSTSTPLTAPLR